MAFTHPSWRSRPLIGQVLSVEGENATIHWWIGSYSSTWKACCRRQQGQQVDWTESIPISTIVHCFQWKMKEGKPARLPPSLKDALKSMITNHAILTFLLHSCYNISSFCLLAYVLTISYDHFKLSSILPHVAWRIKNVNKAQHFIRNISRNHCKNC